MYDALIQFGGLLVVLALWFVVLPKLGVPT
jgi:hypothetical protein